MGIMTPFIQPTYIIAILIAISVHEWAHAFMANRLGDPTAEQQGRLTLNPIAHIDLLGALMFIMIGFGWAKPVPVNPLYFKKPNRDMAIVALAGPVSNLILATIAFFALFFISGSVNASPQGLLDIPRTTATLTILTAILQSSLFVNLALMAFNLFPVAPLDGSNILRNFIPRRYQDKYEDFVNIGPWILLTLIVLESILPIRLLSAWVYTIMNVVMDGFAAIAMLFT